MEEGKGLAHPTTQTMASLWKVGNGRKGTSSLNWYPRTSLGLGWTTIEEYAPAFPVWLSNDCPALWRPCMEEGCTASLDWLPKACLAI